MQYNTIKTVKRHGKLHNTTVAKFEHKNTGWRVRRVAPFHNNKSNISLTPGVTREPVSSGNHLITIYLSKPPIFSDLPHNKRPSILSLLILSDGHS